MRSRCSVCVFFIAVVSLQLTSGRISQAQSSTPAGAIYDPTKTFAPLTLPDPVNVYRSSNGAPGPSYWQNEADYDLHPTIDVQSKQLSATETITYTNNS